MAGNHRKLQLQSSDAELHINALEDKKQVNAKKIIMEIESTEMKRQQKLALQMQREYLRTKLGGVTDLLSALIYTSTDTKTSNETSRIVNAFQIAF